MGSILWLKLRNKILRFLYRNVEDEELKEYIRSFEGVRLNVKLEEARIVCLDIETTGLDLSRSEIVSIGAIGVRGLKVDLEDSFFTLVKSGGEITEESIKIHKITPDLLANAVRLKEALKGFLRFIKSDPICTFSPFDVLMINRDLKRLFGITLLNPFIDVQKLGEKSLLIIHPYYHQIMNIGGMSLEELATRLEIPIFARHTSLGDAYTTSLMLINIIKKKGIRTLEELYMLS